MLTFLDIKQNRCRDRLKSYLKQKKGKNVRS
jgi:hypothetical protein